MPWLECWTKRLIGILALAFSVQQAKGRVQLRYSLFPVAAFVLSALLLLQAPTAALAFSSTVTSAEVATLTSAQLLDIKTACVTLK
ncbi:MAG: hypothetical protein ACRD5H_06685, partial [Nitrososphaerales archaeon]